jgi:hypothetical protein
MRTMRSIPRLLRLYASRASEVTPRKLLRFVRPQVIDQLLYVISLSDHDSRHAAKVPLEIAKFADKSVTRYDALVDGKVVHHTVVRRDTLLPVQFGFEPFPVLGESVTSPAFRGLGIYPHVLGQILADLKQSGSDSSVFMLVAPDNAASIRGIERAGFRLLARLRGMRLGPLVWRSGSTRRSGD